MVVRSGWEVSEIQVQTARRQCNTGLLTDLLRRSFPRSSTLTAPWTDQINFTEDNAPRDTTLDESPLTVLPVSMENARSDYGNSVNFMGDETKREIGAAQLNIL